MLIWQRTSFHFLSKCKLIFLFLPLCIITGTIGGIIITWPSYNVTSNNDCDAGFNSTVTNKCICFDYYTRNTNGNCICLN